MIPEFPQFKQIELIDKPEVEKITEKYLPYSDFNFVSMWSWNIKGGVCLSIINGNLAVRFADYITGKPFYSFLGDNKIDETAESLMELSKRENSKPELRLIPEESVKGLGKKFIVLEDEDNFDYILDLEKLKSYKGKELSSHRHHANQFIKNFNYKNKVDTKEEHNWSEVFSFFDRLHVQDKPGEAPGEMQAIKKLGSATELHDKILMIKIYVDNAPAAITICELVNDIYAMGHFIKADKALSRAVMSHLIKETAQAFDTVRFINIEQDLGKPGLRLWKKGFRPALYLKKYIIRYNEAL